MRSEYGMCIAYICTVEHDEALRPPSFSSYYCAFRFGAARDMPVCYQSKCTPRPSLIVPGYTLTRAYVHFERESGCAGREEDRERRMNLQLSAGRVLPVGD